MKLRIIVILVFAADRGPCPRSGRCRDPSTNSARGSSTSATSTRTIRGRTFKRQIDEKAKEDARYPGALQGRHGVHQGHLPQQRGRHGHSRVSVPAAEQARRPRPRRDDLGPRRRARQLEHHAYFPFVKEAVAARLRHHRARVSRQHRLRRAALPGDRLRRQGSGRRDERVRLSEDAAARRSRSRRHDGVEPRRLHHAAVALPRPASVQGRRRDRAGHQPRVPPLVQRPRLPARLLDAEGHARACRSRSARSTSSARRSITSTS